MRKNQTPTRKSRRNQPTMLPDVVAFLSDQLADAKAEAVMLECTRTALERDTAKAEADLERLRRRVLSLERLADAMPANLKP